VRAFFYHLYLLLLLSIVVDCDPTFFRGSLGRRPSAFPFFLKKQIALFLSRDCLFFVTLFGFSFKKKTSHLIFFSSALLKSDDDDDDEATTTTTTTKGRRKACRGRSA